VRLPDDDSPAPQQGVKGTKRESFSWLSTRC
jgi:hypothetical protein